MSQGMRIIVLALIGACLGLLVSCGAFESMSPEQKKTVIDGLNEMLKAGTISQSQFEALMAVLSGSSDWSWLQSLGTGLGSIILSLLGVKAWRGGITSRKGKVA